MQHNRAFREQKYPEDNPEEQVVPNFLKLQGFRSTALCATHDENTIEIMHEHELVLICDFCTNFNRTLIFSFHKMYCQNQFAKIHINRIEEFHKPFSKFVNST